MTTPRYAATGCADESQVQGLASPSAFDSDNSWIVNFNNGNSNTINRNNNAFVRAVRSAREYQGDQVSFHELHQAWKRARAKKVPSTNQLSFEANWIDNLLRLQEQINAGTWSPRPTTCFIAQRPKARQIHAPDFSDRVVHHWLVPKLDAMFEHRFIHDSYANRRGKGTHAAVNRLRDFVREVDSGQGSGWYLQLDVRNFFNSVHRPTLYAVLKRRMQREHAPEIVQRVTLALVRATFTGFRSLPKPPGSDWWIVLGVAQNAGKAEVETAYRNLRSKHHPDRAGGSAEEFERVQRAYKEATA